MNLWPPRIVDSIGQARWSLAEVFIVAILIALSVNLAASLIVEHTSTLVTGMIALGTAAAGISILVIRQFQGGSVEYTFRGFLISGIDGMLQPVEQYDLASDVAQFQGAAFAENPALARQWESEPLSDINRAILGPTASIGEIHRIGSIRIANELVQYAVLNHLSTHLTDYFNKLDEPDAVVTLARNDMPSILLSNRILALISGDMRDRAMFHHDTGKRNALLVYVSSGAVFQHFELGSVFNGRA
jgi:hypothetical protein